MGSAALLVSKRKRRAKAAPAPELVRLSPFPDVALEMCAAMSPLEWLMQEAIKHVFREMEDVHTTYLPKGEVSTFADFPPLATRGVVIAQQVEVGTYIADFAVLCRSDGPRWRGAIECDGHNYHERTPEQARHDRTRDRYFTASAIHPLRYTGDEIRADAVRCAREAIHICMKLSEL